ncbi:alpha-L-fucosidase [Paenibacillus aurantius]|uniref:alpha-L-fucosidase n=1 Tax=Paenibacillus aurantius TaxID=2918900 RepID=A0AA96LF84_9BACL|nr:alpha-L-fucosidase [Paenibacillus aurantius]WNQ12787.1 alpha-L-fucosidase [Paenibacillus aurantius]
MAEREDLMDNAEELTEFRPEAADAEGHDGRIAWWREARVGLFVHWGLYSLPGGIWRGEEVKASYAEHLMLRAKIPATEYETIADDFRAEHFDAKLWARTARMAGLKYLIITAKHHDGFAMYDSDVSDYNIVKRTPFGRDPLEELAEACREEGVKLCVYYSHSMDWHHPDSQGNTWDYPGNIGAYDDVSSWVENEDKRTRYESYLHTFALPQVKELLEKYGPIGLMWFDCGHKLTEEQGAAFVRQVREVQPDCLVNRRVWKEPFGDYGNSSDNQPHVRVPRKDWESIATLNDSWGYKANDRNWKTAEAVLRQMIDVLSLNGNFVINVGPTGDGAFDPKSVELLDEMGAWMKRNGEAVYGTEKSPIGKPPWGRCTVKGGTLYGHLFDPPASGRLVVPGLRNPVQRAYLLADPDRLPLPVSRLGGEDLLIELPAMDDSVTIPVVALEFEGELDANPVPLLVETDYPSVFGAFDADLAGPCVRYDTGKKDRDNLIGWQSPQDEASWSFRVNGPGRFGVTVTYGAEAAGGTLLLAVAPKPAHSDVPPLKLAAAIEGTGGGLAFRSVGMGHVDIPEAGEYTLTLRADGLPADSGLCVKAIQWERS